MGGEDAMSTYKVCIGPNLTCMNDLLNRMGQFDHVDYNGEQVTKIQSIVFKTEFIEEKSKPIFKVPFFNETLQTFL